MIDLRRGELVLLSVVLPKMEVAAHLLEGSVLGGGYEGYGYWMKFGEIIFVADRHNPISTLLVQTEIRLEIISSDSIFSYKKKPRGVFPMSVIKYMIFAILA